MATSYHAVQNGFEARFTTSGQLICNPLEGSRCQWLTLIFGGRTAWRGRGRARDYQLVAARSYRTYPP